MIAVVVPYFQRERGILRRALASIAAQQGCPLPVHVVVVDDGSPVAAADEIAALEPQQAAAFALTLVRQANAGPGAARNAGLDAVPHAARRIAFLDSDDEWSATHLERACRALDAGHDFYFADLLQLGAETTAFRRAGRIDAAQHAEIGAPGSGLHAYRGDMFDQILRGNVIGTPTVVYAKDRLGALRFRTGFASAGEDYLFWLDVARSGARIAFSTECEVRCGRGVNVFARSGWGSEGHLRRLHDELRFRKLLLARYALTPAQRAHVRAAVGDLRRAVGRDILHRLSHRLPLDRRLLMAHLRLDPPSFAALPGVAVRHVLRRQAGEASS